MADTQEFGAPRPPGEQTPLAKPTDGPRPGGPPPIGLPKPLDGLTRPLDGINKALPIDGLNKVPPTSKPKTKTPTPTPALDGGRSGTNAVKPYVNSSLTTADVVDLCMTLRNTVVQNVITNMAEVKRTDARAMGVANFNITVMSENALNDESGMPVNQEITAHFPMTILRAPVVVRIHITFNQPIRDVEIEEGAGITYMTGDVVNMRALTASLRGSMRFSRTVSERLCPEFKSGIQRYDSTSLFVVGCMMVHTLYTAQINGWNLNRENLPANSITTCDLSADGPNANVEIQIAVDAINSRRIPIHAKWLSAEDWQVIQCLATGLPCFTRQANENRHPLCSTFDCQGFRFFVYDDELVAVPAVAPITADQFRRGLVRLRIAMKADLCFVKGYIRACTLFIGRIETEWDLPVGDVHRQQQQRYFTSGFETQEIDLPNVNGHNFLWDIVGLNNKPISDKDRPQLSLELATLVALPINEFIHISGGIGALYSLGTSAMLHMWNITGRCLNLWANPVMLGPQVSQILNIMNFLFRPRAPTEFTPISRIGCSFLGQFTTSTMMSKNIQSGNWCAGGRNVAVNHGDMVWGNVWPNRIPYILDPLAMTRFFTAFPSIYGYSCPNMNGNFQNAYVNSGNVDDSYIAAHLCEDRYAEAVKSKTPFGYVAFGALMLNYLHQHCRLQQPVLISYRQWAKTNTGFDVVPDWQEQPIIQPVYAVGLHHFDVGTIRTYDWFTHRILVPYIRRVNLAPQAWPLLRMAHTGYSNMAGFIIHATSHLRDLFATQQDLASLFEGADYIIIIGLLLVITTTVTQIRETKMGPRTKQR